MLEWVYGAVLRPVVVLPSGAVRVTIVTEGSPVFLLHFCRRDRMPDASITCCPFANVDTMIVSGDSGDKYPRLMS
jgi:hypothetical protein